MQYKRRYSNLVDKETGLGSNLTILFTGFNTNNYSPGILQRVKFRDAGTRKTFVFLTSNYILAALTIAQLYRSRWQVELSFKWIKQHLRIKKFYTTSENAVKTQVWIAVSVCVLVAIMKKLHSLSVILQISSVSTFEKSKHYQMVTEKMPTCRHYSS